MQSILRLCARFPHSSLTSSKLDWGLSRHSLISHLSLSPPHYLYSFLWFYFQYQFLFPIAGHPSIQRIDDCKFFYQSMANMAISATRLPVGVTCWLGNIIGILNHEAPIICVMNSKCFGTWIMFSLGFQLDRPHSAFHHFGCNRGGRYSTISDRN